MKALAPFDCAAFSELVDLSRIDAGRRAGPYKANGSFLQEARNGARQRYWYYRGYEPSADGSPGTATKTYVGPVGDPAIEMLVTEHAQRKASYVSRRQLTSRLKRAGLPAPQRIEGATVAALEEAGILTGAVIVGSAAFQTYGGLLGVRFEGGLYRTFDLDVAQARGLKLSRGEAAGAPDILDALRRADPSFAPDHHADEPRLIAGFRNATNFRLEFLTPQASARAGSRRLVPVAGLPGVGAQQLRFLEFSLTDTVQSVMLHEAGLLVPVPHPARFAVHKLIVAALRGAGPSDTVSKASKDVLQAEDLVDALIHARDAIALGRSWLDAWGRGPAWRRALALGTLRLDERHLVALRGAVEDGAAMDGAGSPFDADENPRKALMKIAPAPGQG